MSTDRAANRPRTEVQRVARAAAAIWDHYMRAKLRADGFRMAIEGLTLAIDNDRRGSTRWCVLRRTRSHLYRRRQQALRVVTTWQRAAAYARAVETAPHVEFPPSAEAAAAQTGRAFIKHYPTPASGVSAGQEHSERQSTAQRLK